MRFIQATADREAAGGGGGGGGGGEGRGEGAGPDPTAASTVSLDVPLGGQRVPRSTPPLTEGAIASVGVPAGSAWWCRCPRPGSTQAITDQVAALGTVRNRGASADDVTEVVVDLDARIRSLEASVTRLQELVGRAGSVADIAAVERELSNRQAELESLKSQRLQLAGAVERATLTVSLLTPTQSTTTNPLQTGWARGWSAFLASVSILVTVVAALLPFAAVAALVVVPLLWWRRRRRASARVDGVDVRAGQQDSPDQQPYGEGEAQRRPDDTVGDEDEGHRGQGRDQVAD